MATEFILIRHGESVANKRDLFAGTLDLGLTRLGRKQARITAAWLRRRKIDAIYSSPYPRAETTAMYLAKAKKLPMRVCDGVKEINNGIYEGKKFSFSMFEDDPKMKGKLDDFASWDFTGGETVKGVAARFYAAMVEIAEQNDGKTVAVATHSTALAAFVSLVKADCDFDKMTHSEMIPNASLAFCRYENGKFHIDEYGFTGHLKGHVTNFNDLL
jgi:broad specificity phosphatase PhoE